MPSSITHRPALIAHVVYSFGTGGMENGMVHLFNHLPPARFRHVVICLSGFSDFRHRITAQHVEFIDLGKRAGHDYRWMRKLYNLLEELRPDIVHTRNLNALEAQFVAALWGAKGRVHGEHGRDVYDIDGTNWKYNLMRKMARRVVHQYIAVSRDLENWLKRTIRVREERVNQIYNGVDSGKFTPRVGERPRVGPEGFFDRAEFVIGSVGRMAAVKDYPTLIQAFIRLCRESEAGSGMRLVVVGDGPARAECQDLIDQAGLSSQAYFPGDRSDTADWFRAFDLFVLPSLGEGISNTILEAMAAGLPVIATEVGGNPELVVEGETGRLFEPGDEVGLANLLRSYAENRESTALAGSKARARVEASFSWPKTIVAYQTIYESIL